MAIEPFEISLTPQELRFILRMAGINPPFGLLVKLSGETRRSDRHLIETLIQKGCIDPCEDEDEFIITDKAGELLYALRNADYDLSIIDVEEDDNDIPVMHTSYFIDLDTGESVEIEHNKETGMIDMRAPVGFDDILARIEECAGKHMTDDDAERRKKLEQATRMIFIPKDKASKEAVRVGISIVEYEDVAGVDVRCRRDQEIGTAVLSMIGGGVNLFITTANVRKPLSRKRLHNNYIYLTGDKIAFAREQFLPESGDVVFGVLDKEDMFDLLLQDGVKPRWARGALIEKADVSIARKE